MKRLMALILVAGQLVLMLPQRALADDSDIFGANIQPNVLLLIDNSGSMADAAPSNAFDAGTTYPVLTRCDPVTSRTRPRTTTYSSCTSTVVYRSSGSSYSTYANTIADVSRSSARTALNQTGYWSGTISGSTVNLFTGNYINYLLGSCTSGGACLEPKMDIAKRVVNNLLDNVQGVRFGAMTFYYGSGSIRGGRVIAQIGTSISQVKTSINNLSPTGDTPLGDFLYDGGQYYKGATLTDGTSFASPIQLECQPNFVILITDGMQTSGARELPDEATNRYTQDHASSFAGLQNVIVHTVGFGITVNTPQATSDQAFAYLADAARNGGGQFYRSDSATDLEQALQDAIRRIVQATFTFATPVLPTTSTTGSTRAYLASFRSDPSAPFWQGYLKAYQRDSNGLVPLDGNGVPLTSALIWDAGQALTGIAASSRTIHTVASESMAVSGTSTTGTGSLTTFTKTNSAITQTVLGVSTSADRDKVVDFVRGIDVNDENRNSNTTEDRAWKLGDIFHATPVLVTPPVLALNDASYQTFKAAQASRTTVLLAGANDGMLHAFRESDGVELWALIPPDVLDTLKTLTVPGGEHQFFVDSSPIAVDIKVSGSWKTIVVFGERRGGPYYFAVDITDTTAPAYLWSFTDTKIKETWSEPAIGKVKIGGVDKYVAFFGGGYDTAQNNANGKAFFVVDLATGTKLWEYYNNSSSDDRQYMNFSIPANPAAVDLDNDGYIDHVYIGDVGGQMWKFDVSANTTSSWTGKRLFEASPSQANPPAAGEFYPAQAIYGAPSLAMDNNRNVWVFFGTGDRNHPNATASNRFYGIKDNTPMTNGSALTESNLSDVTSSNATPAQGWFFRLGTNEKVLSASNVFNMNVFFSGFTPTSVVTCTSGGGTAKLYAVQVQTGYAAINFSTGVALSSPDSSSARSTTIGSGIASMPVIVMAPPTSGGTASASAITATSNQQLPNNRVPPPSFLKQVRSWRERIQ
jgi:type IV pilus assembly protein PilY1